MAKQEFIGSSTRLMEAQRRQRARQEEAQADRQRQELEREEREKAGIPNFFGSSFPRAVDSPSISVPVQSSAVAPDATRPKNTSVDVHDSSSTAGDTQEAATRKSKDKNKQTTIHKETLITPRGPTLRGDTPRNPTLDEVSPPNPTRPVAPERDFNKRANSLDRQALPAGLFPGSSKKLYDALYIRTRGAIAPDKKLRATKRELSEWSGIRNVKTIDAHLRYFSAIGLIASEWERGQNSGSLYEVRLPEETTGLFTKQISQEEVTPPYPPSPHVTPSNVESHQNLGLPPYQNLESPHLTQVSVDSTTSTVSKTSFNTNTEQTDDDATALAGLIEALKTANRELTGKNLAPSESERWRELADILITELKIAAARTNVSSVPAFFAEHLRRRLWKKDKKQIAAEQLSEDIISKDAKLSIEEIKNCPDCFGTGMFYPKGFGQPVARCKHEKLKESGKGEESPTE